MAITRTYSGTALLDLQFFQTLTGDAEGSPTAPRQRLLETWDNDGGNDPHFSGWLYGALTISAGGDILLAHATDPLQAFGASVYSDGFTVAGSKLKLLYIRNTHASQSFKFVRKTTNGLPIFDTVTAGVTLSPGSKFLWEDQGGDVIGALTTGSNDALTFSLPGTASSAVLLAIYGT